MNNNRRRPLRALFNRRPASIPPVSLGQQQARHALIISLILILALSLVAAAAILTVSSNQPGLEIPADWIPFGMVVFSVLSALLIRSGRVRLGIRLQLATFLIGALLEPWFSQGYGLSLGISAFLVSVTIASLTLSGSEATLAISLGFLAGIGAVLIDQFGSPNRIPGAEFIQAGLPILALFTLAVFFLLVLRQMRFFSLRARLVAIFVTIVLAPLGLMSLLNNTLTRQALIDAANQTLMAAAQQTANTVEGYITGLSDSLATEARLPAFQEYLALPEGQRRGSAQETTAATLLQNLNRRAGSIAYTLLDRQGNVLLDTIALDASTLPRYLSLDVIDYYYFYNTLLTGLPYLSPVIFPGADAEPYFFVAGRVEDENGLPAGMVLVRYPASIFQTLILRSNGLAGEHSYAILLDENHLRLANGHESGQVYQLVAPLESSEIARLQSIFRLPQVSPDEMAAGLPEFAAALRDAASEPFFAGELGTSHLEAVTLGSAEDNDVEQAAITALKSRNWQVVFVKPQELFLAPVAQLTRFSILTVLVIAFISTATATLLAQWITRPIRGLTAVAQEITSGNLTVQANEQSQTEVGALSSAFNAMTEQLRQTLASLEQRVEERTAELAQVSQQMQNRAHQLQQVAEISHTIASLQDIDQLLFRVTQLISDRFGFYHVGVFLLDPSAGFAVLRATNSEGGQRMLARGHRLRVGQEGIVGYVTANRTARIALDVGKDAVFFDNPDLPLTRSEIALPLLIGERILGALDVQSTQPAAFSEEDVALLSTLADQVSVAIENASLFGETRRTLQEMQTAQRQYVGQAWGRTIKDLSQPGFQYRLGRLQPAAPEEFSVPWQRLAESGASLILPEVTIAGPLGIAPENLTIPISLRGEVIGAIQLGELDSNRRWSDDEITFARSIAEQVGLALENARLIEETQRRAEREHLVSEITTRLRSSNDPQTIMQTAMSELRKALHAKETRVILQERPLAAAQKPNAGEPGAADQPKTSPQNAERGEE